MWASLSETDLSGKTVLLRTDYNVPLASDGTVRNTKRLRSTLPTLRLLHEAGAKTLVLTHLGRPDGKRVESLTTDRLVDPLFELLQANDWFSGDVSFVQSVDAHTGEAVSLALEAVPAGGFLLLQNARFLPGEQGNDLPLARAWAELADLYVNDAFAVSHRAHASVVGIPEHLPSFPGCGLEMEWKVLTSVLQSPAQPLVVVMGGVKMETRIPMLKNFLDVVGAERILLGGAMANTFLVAAGHSVGGSLYEEAYVEEAASLLETYGERLLLPVDVVVAPSIDAEEAAVSSVAIDSIPDDVSVLDIGPETVACFAEYIGTAGTMIWNGPMGVFERDPFSGGTRGVAQACAASSAYTVIGGGDTASAIESIGVQDAMNFVSTGGGASLMLFEGVPLPGITALDRTSDSDTR